jgi:hypothetical protein
LLLVIIMLSNVGSQDRASVAARINGEKPALDVTPYAPLRFG